MNKPTPKPAPGQAPNPPDGWETKPVFIQIENDEKRLTLKFQNIDAMADWLASQMNKGK